MYSVYIITIYSSFCLSVIFGKFNVAFDTATYERTNRCKTTHMSRTSVCPFVRCCVLNLPQKLHFSTSQAPTLHTHPSVLGSGQLNVNLSGSLPLLINAKLRLITNATSFLRLKGKFLLSLREVEGGHTHRKGEGGEG